MREISFGGWPTIYPFSFAVFIANLLYIERIPRLVKTQKIVIFLRLPIPSVKMKSSYSSSESMSFHIELYVKLECRLIWIILLFDNRIFKRSNFTTDCQPHYLIRTNFRAFAQKSEKCVEISTVITRKRGMREN